ncbi:Sti1p [Paramicrosporidium saccamoebae]|uniref:Sti1p n=1 Tax=Paramicrosporidium saccamoebae TaxID=1246581 RepID=A0A2H9TNW3_9FUNG|nr:Sti1p [Paramicrosporidium saccamoebae]
MFVSKVAARAELEMSGANEGPTTKLTRLYEDGKEALADRNYKKAIKKFDKALAEFDPNSDTRHDKAIVLCARSAAKYHSGKYDESLKDAELAVQTRPESSKEEDPRSLDIVELRIVRLNQEKDAEESGLYFRQLRPGFDICRGSYNPIKKLVYEFARGMQNIVYAVGDTTKRECLIFDACWDSDGILEAISKDGMVPVGCVITHNHFDHVGGKPPPPFRSYGVTVQGVKNILERHPKIPVYVHQDDADTFQNDSGVDPGRIITTRDGFEISVGEVSFKLWKLHSIYHWKGEKGWRIEAKEPRRMAWRAGERLG